MASSKVITLRVSEPEHERWRRVTGELSFNAWARRSLNEAAAYEEAKEKEQELPAPVPIATPHRCPPKGVYCKGCGK